MQDFSHFILSRTRFFTPLKHLSYLKTASRSGLSILTHVMAFNLKRSFQYLFKRRLCTAMGKTLFALPLKQGSAAKPDSVSLSHALNLTCEASHA